MARIVGMITRPPVHVVEEDASQDNAIKEPLDSDYSSMSREEVKALLEEKGIEYNQHTGTEKLIKLLEGAE